MYIKDTNKIAIVDLTKEEIQIKNVPFELIKQYVGGRGLNSRLLYEYTNEEVKPLSEDNVFIVGTGALVGLNGLNFSRTTITAKSPESGLLGDANVGGGFGVNLRKNGVGYLLLKGKAATPKLVVVGNQTVEIKDAAFVWGKDTQSTQEEIKRQFPGSESLCIGPAGENKVVFACLINRKKNAAARCGMGAVLGSKNVKAIVALDNSQEVEAADKQKFFDCVKEINLFLQKEFLMQRLKEFGSSHLYEIVNESIGMGRVKNGRSLAFLNNDNINHKNLAKFYKEKAGCKKCVVKCQMVYEYKGIVNEGPEYGVMAHFGPVLGIGKLESTLILNDLVNRLGLDASSSANIIAWLIELYQEKVIDDKVTRGRAFLWDDVELVKSLIEDIAYRKGIGDFIASGPRAMVEELGKKSEQYLCWTKNMVQSEPADLRYLPAFALSNSVASRGSDHLRSRPIWVAFEFGSDSLKDIYGCQVDGEALSYTDKGKIVVWWEHYLGMFDMVGLCKFLGFHTMPPGIKFSFFSRLMEAAYGESFSEEDLKISAQRVINIERLYLQREGIDRKNDYPPQKVFLPLAETEGVREEDKEIKLDRTKYDAMLDEYYTVRGWDLEGKVKTETVERLKIKESVKI
ncbi:MAG: aldehyde ferredoxin oxidoreductase C-terminal domain-containing protein [Candidatus Omnitrophota bacterium]|nr:hypothetical protein [Candidatus Omnitrophota bacterium]